MNDFSNQEHTELPETPAAEQNDAFSTVFSDPTAHKKNAVKPKRRLLPIILSSVLAVAVLAGGTVAVVKLIPEKDDTVSTPELEEIQVLDLKSDNFKSVTVTNQSGTFKLYSVTEETTSDSSDTSSDTESETKTVNWYLDGYDRAVINPSLAGNIAGYAASLKATREVTAKSAAECGLEKPTVQADVVTNDDAAFSILVGGESPDSTGTYVKLSTEDKIYLCDSSITDNFSFDALSLAATDAIAGITVTDDIKSYADDNGALNSFDTITLTGTKYPEKIVIAPNADSTLSDYAAYMTTAPTKRIADKVDDIFGLFKSGVTVSGAYSFDTSAAARRQLGLDKPELTAAIQIGSVKQSYSFKQQSDGDYAVWYEGAKLIQKVAASSLAFIDYQVNDYYASWVCLQAINDLSSFTVQTPEKTYSFDIQYDDSEDAKETYVITYEGTKLTAENFQNFYQECISLSCADYTVESLSGTPAMTLVFTYSDTSRGKSTVEFRKASETKYQYRIDGIDMGKVTSSSLNKILKDVKKAAADETVN